MNCTRLNKQANFFFLLPPWAILQLQHVWGFACWRWLSCLNFDFQAEGLTLSAITLSYITKFIFELITASCMVPEAEMQQKKKSSISPSVIHFLKFLSWENIFVLSQTVILASKIYLLSAEKGLIFIYMLSGKLQFWFNILGKVSLTQKWFIYKFCKVLLIPF